MNDDPKKPHDRELTAPYGRYLVRLIRPFPDFDFFFIKSVRQRAAQLLRLRSGDRVLDAGCGPGGSFRYLVDAVGPAGEVVGVEISPEMSVNARQRIAKNQWRNVRVIVADARIVQLESGFDGLLMFGAPDVYASAQALDHLLPYLKHNARVVAFGAKLSRRGFGRALNPVLRTLWKLSFPSTPALTFEPWAIFEKYLGEVKAQEIFFGCMFLAWGTLPRS